MNAGCVRACNSEALFSVLTHAGAAGAVQSQALGALAAEGALSVQALAVCAHAGEHFALVDVCGVLKSIAMQKKKDVFHFRKECLCTFASPRDRFLPSQMRPFIRANPREQAVSEGETRGLRLFFKNPVIPCSSSSLTGGCI